MVSKTLIKLGDQTVVVRTYIENRRAARVSITKTGVNIRFPAAMPPAEQQAWFAQSLRWAEKKLAEAPTETSPTRQRRHEDGQVLKVGDRDYCLAISYREKKTCSARIVGDTIHLVVSSRMAEEQAEKSISTLISRCLGAERLPALRARVERLNEEHFQVAIGTIRFKYLKSRWGSCSAARNINISTRLLLAPEEVLESVVVHELAHLIVQDHSPAFWALVERAVPDWRRWKLWLKKHGDELWF